MELQELSTSAVSAVQREGSNQSIFPWGMLLLREITVRINPEGWLLFSEIGGLQCYLLAISMGRGCWTGGCVSGYVDQLKRTEQNLPCISSGCTTQNHPTTFKTHAVEIRNDAAAPGICSISWEGKTPLVLTRGQASRTGGSEEKCNSFTGFYN